MTSLEAYRAALAELPIVNPSAEDMARLCPHLTRGQAIAAFTDGADGTVALPPLLVDNAVQFVHYRSASEGNAPALIYLGAGRVTDAAIEAGIAKGAGTHPHMVEAVRFARLNWGAALTADTWVEYRKMWVEDPTDLDEKDFPKVVHIFHVALSRRSNVISNDYTFPESSLIGAAIVRWTDDPFVGEELKGGRSYLKSGNCAHCAYGLSVSSCRNCGHQFSDNGFSSGWSTPLPRKLVGALSTITGWKFGMDPELAFAKEAEDFFAFRVLKKDLRKVTVEDVLAFLSPEWFEGVRQAYAKLEPASSNVDLFTTDYGLKATMTMAALRWLCRLHPAGITLSLQGEGASELTLTDAGVLIGLTHLRQVGEGRYAADKELIDIKTISGVALAA